MRYFLLLKVLFLSAGHGHAQSVYTNPIYGLDFPDPTVIRGHDGMFYAYATNTSVAGTFFHIQVAKSSDLIHWSILGDALPVKPSWADKDFWAPHVLFDQRNQQYYLYYSGESPGDQTGKCIGVAVSKNPAGPFVDIGKPLLSGKGFETIDPMVFDDPVSGKKYLYWGSGHQPIKVRELNDDRISFKAGSIVTAVVAPNEDDYSKLVEGAWVRYRDGYYYLFYSGDNCCGDKANYAVMVARSKNPEGPFERLSQVRGNNSSAILEKNDAWLAPGHNSIITDDAGKDWIVYHAIGLDAALKSKGRIMLIDRLQYKDGWPFIENGTPTTKSLPIPFINNNNSK
jgi:arabinan endo-1,5-alpha-L-arabinosidase